MSERYAQLASLMQRPEGCTVHTACTVLAVTPSTYRGMVRDLNEFLPITTVKKGRVAVHYIKEEMCQSA